MNKTVLLPPRSHSVPCRTCRGDLGWYMRGHWVTCSRCNGTGNCAEARRRALSPRQQRRVLSCAATGGHITVQQRSDGAAELLGVGGVTSSKVGRLPIGRYHSLCSAGRRVAEVGELLRLNGLPDQLGSAGQ